MKNHLEEGKGRTRVPSHKLKIAMFCWGKRGGVFRDDSRGRWAQHPPLPVSHLSSEQEASISAQRGWSQQLVGQN